MSLGMRLGFFQVFFWKEMVHIFNNLTHLHKSSTMHARQIHRSATFIPGLVSFQINERLNGWNILYHSLQLLHFC